MIAHPEFPGKSNGVPRSNAGCQKPFSLLTCQVLLRRLPTNFRHSRVCGALTEHSHTEVRMKFDAKRNFLLALLAAVAVGCQSLTHLVGPKQEPANQAAPPVSQLGAPDETYASEWESGRAIYVGGCASCHKPKPIQEFAIDRVERQNHSRYVGEGQAYARANAIACGLHHGRQALSVGWQRACQGETSDNTDIGGRQQVINVILRWSC